MNKVQERARATLALQWLGERDAQVISLQEENKRLTTERDGLLAEVVRMKNDLLTSLKGGQLLVQDRNHLQSELIKARALPEDSASCPENEALFRRAADGDANAALEFLARLTHAAPIAHNVDES